MVHNKVLIQSCHLRLCGQNFRITPMTRNMPFTRTGIKGQRRMPRKISSIAALSQLFIIFLSSQLSLGFLVKHPVIAQTRQKRQTLSTQGLYTSELDTLNQTDSITSFSGPNGIAFASRKKKAPQPSPHPDKGQSLPKYKL